MPQWWTDLNELTAWTGPTLYLVVFALVFTESGILIGFLLPGDTVLFAAGLLSARPETGISTAGMILTVVVAGILGDMVGYESGRRLGRPWLERRTRAESGLARADAFIARWGSLSLIVCRFIPWLRTFVPILAGVSRMPYRTFMLANVVGAVIWGAGLVGLGRLAYENSAVRWVAIAVAGAAIAFSVAVGIMGLLARRRGARNTDTH